MNSEFKIGQKFFIADFSITSHTIKAVDVIGGINKYWLDDIFGYYTKDNLFASKNEAIDHIITVLERMKDD